MLSAILSLPHAMHRCSPTGEVGSVIFSIATYPSEAAYYQRERAQNYCRRDRADSSPPLPTL